MYQGAFLHASNRVLEQLAKGEPRVRFGAGDDLVSLVRTVFVFFHPEAEDYLEFAQGEHEKFSQEAAAGVLKVWDYIVPPAWKELEALAAECDHKKLQTRFNDMLPPF